MRTTLFLTLLIHALIAAGSLPMGAEESITSRRASFEDGSIVITSLETYPIAFTDDLLGMSFDDSGWPRLLAVSSTDNKLYGLEPLSADSVDELALCTSNQNGWGVAWFSPDLLYTNDTNDTALFGYVSGGWLSEENDAGSDGRGMDFCDDLFWQAVSQGGQHRVVSWDPMSGIWTWSDISAQIPGQLSGLTVFASGGQSYLCVTTLYQPDIWVYAVSGREISEYIGSAALPDSAEASLGLTYSESFNTFYWCYASGGSTFINQFEMTIDSTSLNRASWGSIKTLP